MIHNCERFEVVFLKVMCKIRYRRIARVLKQVSSIQFVKLNTSMADNRFGGVVLKPSRIGSVDTRIQWSVELERQDRSNKNFYAPATPEVSVPLCGCQSCLHLLSTLFFPAKSVLIVPTLSTLIILVRCFAYTTIFRKKS